MKRLFYLLIPTIILASCGGKETKTKTTDAKTDSVKTGRVVPVAVTEVQPVTFHANVEIQAAITGDEVVTATARVGGTVTQVLAQVGQQVHQGQVLATLDANTIEEQIRSQQPQIDLLKSLYEKQQNLWSQNIGTEVQLMSAKTQYESALSQRKAMQAQRALYNIVSPINGVVDMASIKVGDQAGGVGNPGFQIINMDKMKAVASLGENYLGKVKEGDPVTLIFPVEKDSIKTRLTYVSQSVNGISRAFDVQVKLGSNKKLHPNMSCVMKIANYTNPGALVVPVSVIQNTPNGSVIYVADNGKAKAVIVKTGQTANGMAEILGGLNNGDQVITTGYEDLSDGDAVAVQK